LTNVGWVERSDTHRLRSKYLFFTVTKGMRMNRKLSSGEYRLYSRKKNPKNGQAAELGNVQDARGGAEA
jgi:hypothetical protein